MTDKAGAVTSKTVERWTWTRVNLEDLTHLGYISRHKTGEFVHFTDHDSREGELLAEIERLTLELSESQKAFTDHTSHVRTFLEELGPYLGIEYGSVATPADFIQAAERIRQWCADHQRPAPETPQPADQQYIELNLSNYDATDVERLNAWGIWAHREIERRSNVIGHAAALLDTGHVEEARDVLRVCFANETYEPPVLGAGDGLPRMPTRQEAIEAHVQQIQILCDATGRDPTEWLSDNAAQGETGDRTQLHGALTRVVLEAQGCPPNCSHEFHTWAIRSILKIAKDALARVQPKKANDHVHDWVYADRTYESCYCGVIRVRDTKNGNGGTS